MSGRRDLVSDEDLAFFRHAVQDAKPLDQRPLPVSSSGLHRKVFLPVPSHEAPRFAETRPSAPPITGHTEVRLKRGRLAPQARVDLHGHGYEAAYRTLVSFLTRAYAEGKNVVLVITGKGGVLRPHVPLWLNGPELRDVVIGIREAHARHGGSGAFYVALHKRKTLGMR